MGDLSGKKIWQMAPIRDVRRLDIDGYYFNVDKANVAGEGRDFRRLPMEQFHQILGNHTAGIERRLETIEFYLLYLVDGIYASGFTTDLTWSPGVTTPTLATRLPLQTLGLRSNLDTADIYGFTPQFAADYRIDLFILVDGDAATNNRVWWAAVFVNGVQAGTGQDFNTRDVSLLFLASSFFIHLDAGDVVDVRFWSTDGTSSIQILDYTYNMQFLGLDVDPGQIIGNE